MQISNLFRTALGALTVCSAFMVTTDTVAQTANATIPATCTQSGSVITCTTTTTFAVPASVSLTAQTGGSTMTLTASTGPTGPSCSALTASPNPVTAPGAFVTLTATCAQGNYSYYWNGSTTASSSSSIQVATASTAGQFPQTMTVQVCPAGTSTGCTSLQTSVSLQGSSITAPTGCTISPASPTIASATSQTFSVSCTGGSAPTTWAWTRDGTSIGSTQSVTDTPFPSTSSATTAAYAVTVGNSAGSMIATTTATKASSVVNYCGSQTYPNYIWFDSTQRQTTQIQPQYGDNIYTIQLTIGANQSTAGRSTLASIGISEGPSAILSYKHATISRNPCDFNTATSQILIYDDLAATTLIAINDPRAGAGFVRLTTGTWYINVKNIGCGSICNSMVDNRAGWN